MGNRLGRRLADIIHSKVTYIPLNHAGTRQIEEAVEMALAMGADTGSILTAVTDALHNEAKKAGVYPSNLELGDDDEAIYKERKVELADMLLQIKYLAHLAGVKWKEVREEAHNKIHHLENLNSKGELTIYPTGKIYRIKRD